ncbi:MAG: HU family DNA-binding protein [Pelagibacteraceae bacterium]|jgi:integration host factor subunit alpha|nr:HU family DNA-binding protein [Pelagibacteraceae bacterium]
MKVIRENTHKKDIIKNIYRKIGLPNTYAAQILNDIINILTLNIITKKIIKIKNFGTFYLKKKSKRVGRNPKNKKIDHEISERNVVIFKPSELLKKKLNIHVGQ